MGCIRNSLERREGVRYYWDMVKFLFYGDGKILEGF